jgi:elongation factor Ts
MTDTDKLKHVRTITQSPMNKVAEALKTSNGDVDKAIAWLISQKAADATDIQKRSANSNAVFSYVHSGRIGAMIVLAAQTDFVLRNELFTELAKNLCMHIVSAPNTPEFVSKASVPEATIKTWTQEFSADCSNKPVNIQVKIIEGKIKKRLADVCLLNQPFVKDDQITVAELIAKTSATVGEKIEIKKFVRLSA